MATRARATWQKALWGLGILILVGAVVVFLGVSNGWWSGQHTEIPAAAERPVSYELVTDARGRPVKPYTLRLFPVAVSGLQVTRAEVRPAGPLALPSQVGTLGYDTDRLYSVRARFPGEVIALGTATESHRRDGSSERVETTRFLGPGDWVRQGDLLAVLWSKELGDRKVALVSALLDWYLDRELLAKQEPAYLAGSLSDAQYQTSVNKVEKDLSAINAAEAGLGISRLTPKEIEEIRSDAKVIQNRLRGKPETPEQRMKRLGVDVQKWAKVVITAPRSGVIVEKNTNVSDMVDSSKDTPMFRIANLDSLLINVNFNEEYLPLLQPLMRKRQRGWSFLDDLRKLAGLDPLVPEVAEELRWRIHIQAETEMPLLDLPVLRIAPGLDPNNHTALVIGRIANPVKDAAGKAKHLIVGQFVSATVLVPPGPGLVEVPTNAMNEVNGESLVLVQPDPGRTEYVLRRVAVVRRSRDTTQVRCVLTDQDLALSADEVRQGRRPLEALRVGDLVVTHGVTEITEAFEGLLAKVNIEKK